MTDEQKRKKRQNYYRNVRKDPIRWAKYLKKRRDSKHKKRLIVLEKRKQSPYWQRQGYERYFKYSPFKRLANYNNKRSNHKVTPFELWCLAKKQKLICAITGEKLTLENISVDHIIPISKNGSNHISNLQLVTRRSNLIKNDMDMIELFSFCQKIVNRLSPRMGMGTTPLKNF